MNDFNPTTNQWNSSVMKFKNDKLHDKLWHKVYR